MHTVALKHHLTDAPLLDWVYLHGKRWLHTHDAIRQHLYKPPLNEHFERGNATDTPFCPNDHVGITSLSLFYEWVMNKCHTLHIPTPQTLHHCRFAQRPHLLDEQYNTHVIVQHVSLSKKIDCNGNTVDLEVTPTLLLSEPLARLLFTELLPSKTPARVFARWTPIYLRSSGKSGWITHTSRNTKFDAMCFQWCQHVLQHLTSHAHTHIPTQPVIGGIVLNVHSLDTPKFYVLNPPTLTLTATCTLDATPTFSWTNALQWALLVRNEGHHWNPVTNTTHAELCAPASQAHIAEHWKPFVHWLSMHRADMCTIYKVTQTQREKAWALGARNYHDLWTMQKALTSVKLLPLSLQIIWTNHQDNPETPDTCVLPQQIQTPAYRDIILKTKQHPFFVADFETIQSKWIFMVATVYYDPHTRTQKVFTYRMQRLNNHEQVLMLHNWIHAMQQLVGDETFAHTPIFHWSPAEPQFLKTLFSKNKELLPLWQNTYPHTYKCIQYDDQHHNALQWMDLCVLFLTEPITVRGCFDFKLKHIIKTLVAHGKLPETNAWADNGLQDGLTAMHMAEQAYREHIDSAFIEIQKYNEADTLVLLDLIRYLLWEML